MNAWSNANSPLSPILAELYMQALESECLPDDDVLFYVRYVDDIFAIVKNGSIETLTRKFTRPDDNIHFTYEEQNANTLPFLDFLLKIGNDGQLTRCVYRKPMHSGAYLNYSSFHHHSHKISVADTLFFRAYMYCDPDLLSDELENIKSDLKSNGYPDDLITRRKLKMKERVGNVLKQEDEGPRFVIPFVDSVTSKRLSSFLKKKTDCNFGFLTGSKPFRDICNNKIQIHSPISGTYKIPCGTDACPFSYDGESIDIPRRRNQHGNDLRWGRESSALVQHLISFPEHRIDVQRLAVTNFEPNYHRRKTMEAVQIAKNKHPMNQDTGKFSPGTWLDFFKTLT